MKIITILFIFFLFLNCNKNKKPVNTLQINNDWIMDSIGCLKKRNKDYSENIIKKYNLKNSNISDFKKIFGTSNAIEKDDSNTEILIYYFDSFCKKKVLQNDSDKCYARFYFRNNELIDKDYICE